MWTAAGQQVAETMSPASAAKVGAVEVILIPGMTAAVDAEASPHSSSGRVSSIVASESHSLLAKVPSWRLKHD